MTHNGFESRVSLFELCNIRTKLRIFHIRPSTTTEPQLSVRECKDIMEELEVMYRHEIIDQPLKKHINFVCRKKINNADIDGSDESTIPLYKPVEQTTTSNDKPTKMRLDQRFLEVIHNGEPL